MSRQTRRQSPVPYLTPALLALEANEPGPLIALTRDQCHLPASSWPWVAEALWSIRDRVHDLANPVAYVRRVALRKQEQAETHFLGRQVVRDEHRRIIGHVTVCGYVAEDGAIDEDMLQGNLGEGGAALGYVPMDETPPTWETRKRTPPDWVDPQDADEDAVQRLQMAGVTERIIADRLGWTGQHVRRVVVRLWRRRRAQCDGLSPRLL